MARLLGGGLSSVFTKKKAGIPPAVSLDYLRLLEGGECAVLLNVAHALGADIDEDILAELRDEDTTLLEVRLAADLARRIKLRRTGTVRVPPADLG